MLVTTAPGAPTADELIEYYHGTQTEPPPLRGLRVGRPRQIAHLLPLRAQGDFLARLEEHPDSVRAQLERYVVVLYPPGTDLAEPLAALRADPYVLAAYLPLPTEFSAAPANAFDDSIESPATSPQYGRDDLNIDAAWELASGYALVADIDSGLRTTHPALMQFSAGTGHYQGGNFVDVASLDVSLAGLVDPPQNSADVDERRAMAVLNPECNPDPQNHPNMQPVTAGHGTHVVGLVSANGSAGLGVEGVCKSCSLAMWKTAHPICEESSGRVVLGSNDIAEAAALTLSDEIGAQVVNMSFGTALDTPYPTYCQYNPLDPMCEAIADAAHHDIAMVASSGNHRTHINFPASDPHVIAAGGFQQNLAIWDLWPQCPPYPFGSECGSNFTLNVAAGAKQELVASAQSVLSTTYPGYNWNSVLQCGDQFPGPGFGNGVGWCTGTSMSAPQIAGVVGILRSINPLVPAGTSPLSGNSIRYALSSTTFEAAGAPVWNPVVGYGRPNAFEAVKKMLGKVAGATVRNRATPLFRLYSAGARDYADVAAPQAAGALMTNTTQAWQPPVTLPAVPNYPTFPHDPAEGGVAAPRASVYVLTTEYMPRPEWPALVPLYLMDKDFADGQVDDFLLTTTVADLEYAHSHGYHLRGIQGYVYQPCTPEPGCIPPGAQKFYRACKPADSDCATFLEYETSAFATSGYITTYPPIGGTKTLLGYAYPATDTDNDGLPDGFEYVAGTSLTRADSDADGVHDALEFPMVGISTRDPCAGGLGAIYCLADRLFADDFDV